MTDNEKLCLEELKPSIARAREICEQMGHVTDALRCANDENLWLRGSYAIDRGASGIFDYLNLIEAIINQLSKE